MVQDDTTDRCIPIFKHQDQDKFLNMLHVALQIRDDMLSQPRPTGIDITESKIAFPTACICVYVSKLIKDGQSMLEHRNDEEGDEDKISAKR